MIDQQGKELGEYAFQHGGAPLKDFVAWVFRKSAGVPPNRVAVAVEAPRGAVIDALLEAGVAVFAINPKQLDRFRDRFSVAGPKDDRRDALVLAHSLRTDMHHFHQLQPDEPRLIRMRELSRAEANTAVELRRESNQLWSYLQRYFPDLLALCRLPTNPGSGIFCSGSKAYPNGSHACGRLPCSSSARFITCAAFPPNYCRKPAPDRKSTRLNSS